MIPVTFMHPPARHSSRLGQRFQLALGAAAALAAISLSPGSAQAYVVTVGGVQYDVTTFTGSYNANISKFETAANGGVMPWWGGGYDLGGLFATAVRENLGTPNSYSGNTSGPIFSVEAWDGDVGGKIWCTADCSGLTNPISIGWLASNSVVYAQATLYTAPTAAPGPLPLFGAAAAFGFSRKLRKSIKRSTNAVSSTYSL
jgi:hypothetical protein